MEVRLRLNSANGSIWIEVDGLMMFKAAEIAIVGEEGRGGAIRRSAADEGQVWVDSRPELNRFEFSIDRHLFHLLL